MANQIAPALKKDLPQIVNPVGSLDELERDCGLSGRDLRTIATCSQEGQWNRGCPVEQICQRDFKFEGPKNQVYVITKADGSVRVTHGPCYFVVRLQEDALSNGGLVEVLAEEGTTYRGRGSVRRHLTPEPGCIACAERRCFAYDDKEDIEVFCPPFPKAATDKDLVKFTRSRGAAAERRRLIEARNRRNLLSNEGQGEAVQDEIERTQEVKRGPGRPRKERPEA